MPRSIFVPSLVFAVGLVFVGSACSGNDPLPETDASSTRTIQQGQVVGYVHPDREAHIWKGLPFAAPPVDDLRWRAPEEPAGWEDVRTAVESGNECVQLDMSDVTKTTGDEDCLYLDIYAPKFATDAIPTGADRRPVMFWIHGGGNSIGGATVYDASRLAVENDVIVVPIQYRLGILGWLRHPALRSTARSAADASGNFGTLDSIRALEWVRDNISAFGGDPNNVTIFGESAGGMNVFALLLSPPAKGLFHRAISQSGNAVVFTKEDAEKYADESSQHLIGSNEILLRYVLKDGRATDRASAKAVVSAMSEAETEKYLRAKSQDELLGIFEDSIGGGMYFIPQLFREGEVIVDLDPSKAFATAGKHNAVPTIAGSNREETKLFSLMTSPNVSHFAGIPTGVNDQRGFDLEGEYGGLLWKVGGVDSPVAAMRAGGRTNVWGYRFDWDEFGSFLWWDLASLLGASHAIDILFVFGFTDFEGFTDNVYASPETAVRLSEQMRAYWAEFARSGVPGNGGSAGAKLALPEWEAWGAAKSDAKYLVFDSEAGGGLRMSNSIIGREALIAKLATDDRVVDTAERCMLFRNFTMWSGIITPVDYGAFQDGACAQWPIEYPPLPGS